MAVDQVQQSQNVTMIAYLLKRRRQVRRFVFLAVLTVCFFFGAAGGKAYKQIKIMEQYERLIGVADSTEYEDKVQSYITGIKLLPSDPRAYIKLLDAYEQNGVFDLEQSGEFTAVYNQFSGKIKAKKTGDLNYKAGRMYFNLYTENGDPVSMSARVQKSASYFESCVENAPNDQTDAEIASCYNTICNYYKNYILKSSDTKEITMETISTLLNAADRAMTAIQSSGEYDQLLMYAAICNVLYDQRNEIAAANGEVLDQILNLLDLVEQRTKKLSVAKEKSSKVQRMILDNLDEYRTAILIAFQ